MKTPKKSSAFRSDAYTFRPTTMSAALMKAGIKGSQGPQMVREEAIVRPVRTA